MSFTEDALKKLQEEFETVRPKYHKLLLSYTRRRYSNEISREHGVEGFPRRLRLLVRCIENVFTLLPPEKIDPPASETIDDAMINIHAFVLNVFGSMDNLAWVWVHERGVKDATGDPLPNGWIGLGPKNVLVRKSFSKDFQAYLQSFDPWFDGMGNYRHGLVHRIPPYVPPYIVFKKVEEEYLALERRKSEALMRFDFEENERLSTEQMKLVEFRPWMQHSFREKAIPIYFHPQLIADYKMIDELGRKMLDELNAIA